MKYPLARCSWCTSGTMQFLVLMLGWAVIRCSAADRSIHAATIDTPANADKIVAHSDAPPTSFYRATQSTPGGGSPRDVRVNDLNALPSVDVMEFGYNVLYGKTPLETENEDLLGSRLFKFTNHSSKAPAVVGGISYRYYDQIDHVNDRAECSNDLEATSVSWALSSSSLSTQASSFNIGGDQTVDVGLEFPLGSTGATGSASSTIHNALVFGNSVTSRTQRSQTQNGNTYTFSAHKKETMYSARIQYDTFGDDDWSDEVKVAVSSLGTRPTFDDIINFFKSFGTHGLKHATFGRHCSSSIFMADGETSSRYREFSSNSQEHLVAFLWWSYDDANSQSASTNTSDEYEITYTSTDKRCIGEFPGSSMVCGSRSNGSDQRAQIIRIAPALVQWQYKPVWEMNIPGLTESLKYLMKLAFQNVAIDRSLECRRIHCNDHGTCTPNVEEWKRPDMTDFWDLESACFCDATHTGTDCADPAMVDVTAPDETGLDEYQNEDKGPMNYTARLEAVCRTTYTTAPLPAAVCGLYSVYTNRDRRFTPKACRPRDSDSFGGIPIWIRRIPVDTNWEVSHYPSTFPYFPDVHTQTDQPFTTDNISLMPLRRIENYYEEYQGDRKWRFTFERFNNTAVDRCEWAVPLHDSWLNTFTQTLNFSCPVGKVMNGWASIHDNGPEDRRFNFRCCILYDDTHVKATIPVSTKRIPAIYGVLKSYARTHADYVVLTGDLPDTIGTVEFIVEAERTSGAIEIDFEFIEESSCTSSMLLERVMENDRETTPLMGSGAPSQKGRYYPRTTKGNNRSSRNKEIKAGTAAVNVVNVSMAKQNDEDGVLTSTDGFSWRHAAFQIDDGGVFRLSISGCPPDFGSTAPTSRLRTLRITDDNNAMFSQYKAYHSFAAEINACRIACQDVEQSANDACEEEVFIHRPSCHRGVRAAYGICINMCDSSQSTPQQRQMESQMEPHEHKFDNKFSMWVTFCHQMVATGNSAVSSRASKESESERARMDATTQSSATSMDQSDGGHLPGTSHRNDSTRASSQFCNIVCGMISVAAHMACSNDIFSEPQCSNGVETATEMCFQYCSSSRNGPDDDGGVAKWAKWVGFCREWVALDVEHPATPSQTSKFANVTKTAPIRYPFFTASHATEPSSAPTPSTDPRLYRAMQFSLEAPPSSPDEYNGVQRTGSHVAVQRDSDAYQRNMPRSEIPGNVIANPLTVSSPSPSPSTISGQKESDTPSPRVRTPCQTGCVVVARDAKDACARGSFGYHTDVAFGKACLSGVRSAYALCNNFCSDAQLTASNSTGTGRTTQQQNMTMSHEYAFNDNLKTWVIFCHQLIATANPAAISSKTEPADARAAMDATMQLSATAIVTPNEQSDDGHVHGPVHGTPYRNNTTRGSSQFVCNLVCGAISVAARMACANEIFNEPRCSNGVETAMEMCFQYCNSSRNGQDDDVAASQWIGFCKAWMDAGVDYPTTPSQKAASTSAPTAASTNAPPTAASTNSPTAASTNAPTATPTTPAEPSILISV